MNGNKLNSYRITARRGETDYGVAGGKVMAMNIMQMWLAGIETVGRLEEITLKL